MIALLGSIILVVGLGLTLEGQIHIKDAREAGAEHASEDLKHFLEFGFQSSAAIERSNEEAEAIAYGQSHKEKGCYIMVAGALVIFMGLAFVMSANGPTVETRAAKAHDSVGDVQ